jgi:hypothetical protein
MATIATDDGTSSEGQAFTEPLLVSIDPSEITFA